MEEKKKETLPTIGFSTAVRGVNFQTVTAVDMGREVAGGNTHVLKCNPMTSTEWVLG